MAELVVEITNAGAFGRSRVERFLEIQYDRAFGGKIRGHYPSLISVSDSEGNLCAAAGFRRADAGPLFLEQYLDEPVDVLIGAGFGGPVARRDIAEIGNLASVTPVASWALFEALARHLENAGCRFAVATATRQLRRTFARARMDIQTLSRATAERLTEGREDWGGYYQRDPEVLAGPINAQADKLAAVYRRAAV
uniref:Putative thermostable hemolysin n=1 Tax=Caulobacter sp. (strain K31) TaxID=366602 RepID=B0T7E0_CAUSK